MLYVDANVILRYLLNDVADQAERARVAIEGGAAVDVEVVAEVVYVLQGVYEVPRHRIAEVLRPLCASLVCSRSEVLDAALRHYGESRLDFVDCVLLATAEVRGDEVLTFDKKLARAIARVTQA